MAVTFSTTGSTFAPVVELTGGSSATITWTCPGFSDETGTTPSFNFGSPAARTVTMTVTGGGGDADIATLNLGYDNTVDVGLDMPAAGYVKAAESLDGIGNLNSLTGLTHFLADFTALAGSLDLSGMSALKYVQVYSTDVTGVTLTGCTALIRLQIEACNISSLDLNPVASNLYDLRAAIQQGGSLTIATLTGTMDALYHYCVRDQTVTGSLTPAQMPALIQYWTWNTGLSGSLDFSGSTTLSDIRTYGNLWTFTNLSGCTALTHVELQYNLLPASAVDHVLNAVNALGTSGGSLDVTVNSDPGATGTASAAALTGRSWTVSVDSGSPTTAAVVQTKSGLNSVFSTPMAAGSWAVLVVTAVSTTGLAISTSSPLFDFAAAKNASLLLEETITSGGHTSYIAMWLLGRSDGTVTGYGLTLDNGAGTGAYALEIEGLSVAPAIDRQSSASDGSSTAIDSGTTAAIRAATAVAIGAAQTYSGSAAGPGGTWSLLASGANGWIGHDAVTVGETVDWAQTANGSNVWTCGVLTLAAGPIAVTVDASRTLTVAAESRTLVVT